MTEAHKTRQSQKMFALARVIRRHLRRQNEVVIATEELQGFLANGKPLDSLEVQRSIRTMATDNHWETFVFDYGALVRFTKASGSGNGRSA